MPERSNNLPNLLVIGAQKAGTTWLHAALQAHPDIFMTARKELSFFDHRDITADSLAEYRGHFAGAGAARYRGESTPGYFRATGRWAATPAKVRAVLGPDVRLVLSLRDPVDRAISAFFHHFRAGRVDPASSILDNRDLGGLILIGQYRRHFEAWSAAFGRAQFFVTLFEEIGGEGAAVAARLQAWLGVEAHGFVEAGAVQNRGLRRRLVDGAIALDQPFPPKAREAFPEAAERAGAGGPQPRVTVQDIADLREIYRQDIAFVEGDLIGRDLGWTRRGIETYA